MCHFYFLNYYNDLIQRKFVGCRQISLPQRSFNETGRKLKLAARPCIPGWRYAHHLKPNSVPACSKRDIPHPQSPATCIGVSLYPGGGEGYFCRLVINLYVTPTGFLHRSQTSSGIHINIFCMLQALRKNCFRNLRQVTALLRHVLFY